MRIERTFSVPGMSEETVHSRVAAIMVQAGYKPAATFPSGLLFRRGSLLGSLTSFSPRGWKVEASIQMHAVSEAILVNATYDINTTGQMVTEKERQFWLTEQACLEEAARLGHADTAASAAVAHSTLRQNIIAGIVIGGLMLLFAFAFAILLDVQSLGFGLALGAVIGILITQRWLNFRVVRKR